MDLNFSCHWVAAMVADKYLPRLRVVPKYGAFIGKLYISAWILFVFIALFFLWSRAAYVFVIVPVGFLHRIYSSCE